MALREPRSPVACGGTAICSSDGVKWRSDVAGAATALVLGLLVLMQAAAVQMPSGLRVGAELLPARSCATRDTLWIHHYAATLYVPPRAAPAAALQDPREPKALHVQILSRSFLPRDLPKKWNQALASELDRGSLKAIQNAWHQISVGDRVTIAYAPGPGVTLQLNEQLVARSPRHGVIDALLKTWADGEPVRERVNQAVAKHPC